MRNIYLYGMIVGSNSFLLTEFVKPDEYSEIHAYHNFPGGETGTCATVLSSLGTNVIIDGNHIGRKVTSLVKDFYKDKSVKLESLYFDESYEGLEDYVLIAGDTRTPIGTFQSFFTTAYNEGLRRWNKPKEEDIVICDVAAIDPFFWEESELAATYCVKNKIPYVTIDCKYDSFLHQHSAISVISVEGNHNNYPGKTSEELFPLFQKYGGGLTIFTNGAREVIYGRNNENISSFQPFHVKVVSTLGAGDSFKAGCTYALSQGMKDDELIRFACACSAIAISNYPLQLYPPTIAEIENLLKL